jgi:hypothetical protein
MNRLFLLMLAACVVSCSNDDNPTNGTPASVISPLSVGKRWAFRISEVDSNYAIVATTFDTTRIVKDTMVSNEKWYVDNKGNVFINRTGGLWQMVNSFPSLLLKYPCVTGEVYLVGTSVSALLADIGSTSFYVRVPSGNYDCYLYRFRMASDSTLVRVDYYAVDKGLVKSNLFARRSSGTYYERYQRELVSRTLN